MNELQPFLVKLKEIKDPTVLSNIYKQVDYNVFMNANDSLALIYSIFELIDIENSEKYRILTLFDQQKRMDVISNIVTRNKERDVSANVDRFIKAQR